MKNKLFDFFKENELENKQMKTIKGMGYPPGQGQVSNTTNGDNGDDDIPDPNDTISSPF